MDSLEVLSSAGLSARAPAVTVVATAAGAVTDDAAVAVGRQ